MTHVSGDWLNDARTQAVCAALTAGGAQALFVGGCVRNALIGVPVTDIDIATDAHPDRVIELAEAAGLKAVPTGIDHGTVTLVAGGLGHEVTTFRRDISTDGRRAVVAFSDRVEEDAARRDFTMNALYAQPDGLVRDPLGGLADLRARRVRFIGDAGRRIVEDYLRSLRYFRFHAHYGDVQAGFDPQALAAISTHLDGLDGLSRERVGSELLKLLAAPDPAPSMAGMRATGVLGRVLTGADDTALAPLVHLEGTLGLNPDPILRLAALGGEVGTLRLSRVQMTALDELRTGAQSAMSPAELGYRMGMKPALGALALRAAFLGQNLDSSVRLEVEKGVASEFPVKAADLMPALRGRALGDRLKELETDWIASGFTLSREALLAQG